MDKLKENIFGISLGVVGLALLVLAYALVYSPLQDLSAKEAELDRAVKSYKKLIDPKQSPHVPTKSYNEGLDKQDEANAAALKSAVAFYEEQAKPFHEYFDGDQPPPADIFVQNYNDSIQALVDGYREKFHIKVDPTQPDQAFPTVGKIDAITEDNKMIPVAMKEYWIIKETFDALTKLQLGGLHSINFPARVLEPKDANKYYRQVNFTIIMDIRSSMIENLLTELFQSKRVPFQLEELSYQKTPEGLGQFQSLERRQLFRNENEAKAADYATLVPEPPVLLTLMLSAFDWQGSSILEEKPEASKPDEPAPGPKQKKK
jgi:hypothetical protein